MIIIGELINASRKAVAGYIETQDSTSIGRLAKDQFNAGAHYIDVNASAFVGKEIEYLKWLIKQVQTVVNLSCCIDSPDPKAIELVLHVHNGTPFINSISLEKNRFDQLLPVVAGTDFKVVALCMSEDGMPETKDQRLKIADQLINALVKKNVAIENIFVDPLVQPISVNQHFGMEFLNAVEQIMTTFKGVHTTCGLSNISYGLPNRGLLNRQLMGMAIAKGMDSAIVNPLDAKMMQVINAAETLAGRDDYCQAYIQAQRSPKKEADHANDDNQVLTLDENSGKENFKRIQTALSLDAPNQIPFTLNVNGPYFSYFCDVPTMEYYDSPKVMLDCQLEVFHKFGRTTTITPEMSLAPEASALGATINWSDDGTAWVEECIHSEADVDNLKLPELNKAGYMTKIFEYHDYMKEHLDPSIPITMGAANSPFTIAALLRGTSEFIGDLVLNPIFSQKLLRKTTDMVLLYLKEQQRISSPAGFKRILLFDDLSGFVNIDLFRKYVIPIYEEIYGMFPNCQRWYHNDSDATHVLEGIADSGIQVFHYGYQVDAALAKEKIGDKVCLMGNIAPLEILRNGTPKDVEQAVKNVIAKSGANGGLIMAAGGYIDEGTPLENVEAMILSCKKFGQKEQVKALVEQGPDTGAVDKQSQPQMGLDSQTEEIDPRMKAFPELKQIKDAVVEGSLGDIGNLVQSGLKNGLTPQDILDVSIVPGMDRVGQLFSSGIIFIPEMMMAANCTKIGMDILNPILAGNGGSQGKKGKIAIGTVLGDLHDIGKDIVISMMQGAGLEVIDLGVDCPPEKYCEAVEAGADLIGMSAILTTVIPNMEKTIELLENRGLRDKCKILIGGAAVTRSVAEEIGADAYCNDAGDGVREAKRFLS